MPAPRHTEVSQKATHLFEDREGLEGRTTAAPAFEAKRTLPGMGGSLGSRRRKRERPAPLVPLEPPTRRFPGYIKKENEYE